MDEVKNESDKDVSFRFLAYWQKFVDFYYIVMKLKFPHLPSLVSCWCSTIDSKYKFQ